MHTPSNARFLSVIGKRLAAVAVCVPLVAMAQASGPNLAGPSMLQRSQAADFSGVGYAPNSAVTIALKTPSGQESHVSAVTGPNGSLSYRLAPTQSGMHSLRVLDSSGKTLSAANLIVAD